jgi:hypothetical protein
VRETLKLQSFFLTVLYWPININMVGDFFFGTGDNLSVGRGVHTAGVKLWGESFDFSNGSSLYLFVPLHQCEARDYLSP